MPFSVFVKPFSQWKKNGGIKGLSERVSANNGGDSNPLGMAAADNVRWQRVRRLSEPEIFLVRLQECTSPSTIARSQASSGERTRMAFLHPQAHDVAAKAEQMRLTLADHLFSDWWNWTHCVARGRCRGFLGTQRGGGARRIKRAGSRSNRRSPIGTTVISSGLPIWPPAKQWCGNHGWAIPPYS
jgi:hypothetical protein